jgi:ATP phosphoribosyltransferase
MIRMALTKGRIEEKALEMLTACGYDLSSLAPENRGRKLLFRAENAPLEIVLAKSADVITYVSHGVCDCGIVGEDTIMESDGRFYELLDLNFGRCRFALAGPAGKYQSFISGYGHKVIASKYPAVTKNYFEGRGFDVEIVKIDGSVELAPILGLSDAIVDIVETGSTLKANGLEVWEEVADVSARLIANTASVKMKKNELDSLMSKLMTQIK